jgi:hypothetical protein
LLDFWVILATNVGAVLQWFIAVPIDVVKVKLQVQTGD